MNRDFKGVWIPKEIWLSKELSMIEKGLLTEISSLDNENHCTAGNEYFAEFCNCSVATITRAISHLKELGYIEELHYDGRIRTLRVINLISPNNQFDEHINTYNNNITKDNTNVLSIVTPPTAEQTSFLEDTPKKTKKKNLYEKCIDAIKDFTDDQEVRDALRTYLDIRLERKDTPLGIKAFNGMLKKLRNLTDSKRECLQIIQQSIDRQYLSFFPLGNMYQNRRTTKVETISGDKVEQVSKADKERIKNSGQKF